MKQLLSNIMLTFIWVAITGQFVWSNFVFGFLLSFFLLWLITKDSANKKYFSQVPKIIGFFLYFLKEMIKANFEVAYDVITPKFFMQPGIVKYPLTATTDMEITLLSNLISLTPGTLILDLSDHRKVLYIHVMYLKSKDGFVNHIKNGLERRLLEIMR
jgi:multicomponent Na+:H+ antiporter subunit E